MRREWIGAGAVGLAAAVLAALIPGAALALRLLGVLLATVPVGAVLMLAIARLTGAQWDGFAGLTRLLPIAAAVLVVALLATPETPNAPLGWWQHPIAVGVRSLLFFVALILATRRLIDHSTTPAAVTLALYAVVITPVATDWLAALPPHPASAIGMMLAVQQIGGPCAAALLLDLFDEAHGRDLARLMVAAMLGLGYLGYVDYLVVWYGNLPGRVPFYLQRSDGLAGVVPCLALLAGIALPIAALSLLPSSIGRRLAGGGAAMAIVLFDGWWLGLSPIAFGAAMLVLAVIALLALRGRVLAHG